MVSLRNSSGDGKHTGCQHSETITGHSWLVTDDRSEFQTGECVFGGKTEHVEKWAVNLTTHHNKTLPRKVSESTVRRVQFAV